MSEVRGPERAVVKGMTWFNDILNVFGGGGGGRVALIGPEATYSIFTSI